MSFAGVVVFLLVGLVPFFGRSAPVFCGDAGRRSLAQGRPANAAVPSGLLSS